MIKINLLAEGKRPTAVRRTKPASFLEGQNAAVLLLLLGFLLLGALPAGGWWWLKSSEIAQKEEEIAEKQRQVDELAAIIREVEEYKKKQEDLRRKIDVINQLRRNQGGPVKMMDAISRAVPELLWLDRMEVTATTVTLTGRAFNTNAVASFVENLDRVPEFQEPIVRDVQQRPPVYVFIVGFGYSYAPPPEQGAAGETTAAGG